MSYRDEHKCRDCDKPATKIIGLDFGKTLLFFCEGHHRAYKVREWGGDESVENKTAEGSC